MRRVRTSLTNLLASTAGEASNELAATALEPLLSYDGQHDGDLIHTLRVYFKSNGNTSQAAEALFLHRNGLMYRLNRIEELLGVPLADPEIRLSLELALHLIEKEDRTNAYQRP